MQVFRGLIPSFLYKLFIYYTLEFDIIWEIKKEKTINRHTQFRSAVYSNSVAINNQKVGVITTRIDAMTFRFHIFE